MTEMTKLTLRLPEPLHRRLVDLARRDARSLNRTIVDALLLGLDAEGSRAEESSTARIKRVLEAKGLIAPSIATQEYDDADLLDSQELIALRELIGRTDPSASSIIVSDRAER